MALGTNNGLKRWSMEALGLIDRRELVVGCVPPSGCSDELVEFSIMEPIPDDVVAAALCHDSSDQADRCKAALLGMTMGDAVGAGKALQHCPVNELITCMHCISARVPSRGRLAWEW